MKCPSDDVHNVAMNASQVMYLSVYIT